MAPGLSSAVRADDRFSVERYFALVDEGVLRPDDRVELLEGVIVATSPQNPPHAASTNRALRALLRAVGTRAIVRGQSPLVIGRHSVPEPDVAVVPGRDADYERVHPTTALLVIEVADSSLLQDRLTKAPIYAAAEIPEFWIVNLRDKCVEIYRDPDARTRRYRSVRTAQRTERIKLVALPAVSVALRALLQARR
ncbi:MAG TPA: Uma2 family endonuclease [Candidatus Binatia bacterium]|nr:Uma2 family endonuclease [Candidatus Binatia bacterium]